MHLKDETIAIQSQLATYCRDGNLQPIKGARKDRLHNYRRLVFNVVRNSLENAYPITSSVLQTDEWDALIQEFFIKHNAQSNQIWQLPYELLVFAQTTSYHKKLDRPYLLDLLYFEWMEIQVFCMPNSELPAIRATSWTENDQLCLNPDHELIELNYPVHKVAIEKLPSTSGSFFLFIFRDLEYGKVQFMEISPFYSLLIELLKSEELSLIQTIKSVCDQLNLSVSEEIKSNVFHFLQSLQTKGAILGSL